MDPVRIIFNQSPIKGTFVCHIMLITWALITVDWMPKVFFFYNFMFFLPLFWSLGSPHNPEPVQLAAIINLLSILLDLMCIATNYSRFHYQDWFGFSLFLLICNLILRAVTSIVLFRVYNERLDRLGSYSGDDRPFAHSNLNENMSYQSNARCYENLDATPTSVTIGSNKNSSIQISNSKSNPTTYQTVPNTFSNDEVVQN